MMHLSIVRLGNKQAAAQEWDAAHRAVEPMHSLPQLPHNHLRLRILPGRVPLRDDPEVQRLAEVESRRREGWVAGKRVPEACPAPTHPTQYQCHS